MESAVRKLDARAPCENDQDEVTRLNAEIQAQQKIIRNYRNESRRLNVIINYQRNENDDLLRALGLMNAKLQNLPEDPAPLIPRRARNIESLDKDNMESLLQALESQTQNLETTAYSALGNTAFLFLQSVRNEDPVAAMEFRLLLTQENPQDMDLDMEEPVRDILCDAIQDWIETQNMEPPSPSL